MGNWENTTYVHGTDVERLAAAIDRLFAEEGMQRVPRPAQRTRLAFEPMQYDGALQNDLWGLAVFPGGAGWTVIKTAPLELLAQRAPGVAEMRLAALCRGLAVSAVQFNEYDSSSVILAEVTPTGSVLISGFNGGGDPFQWNEEALDENAFEPRFQYGPHIAIFGTTVADEAAAGLAANAGGDNAAHCSNLTSVVTLIEHRPLAIAGGMDIYYRWSGASRQHSQSSEWSCRFPPPCASAAASQTINRTADS